jgi:Xaa-Pro aminopeptidase
VTVEPGVYLPDRGGVRIEDTLVVAGGGHGTSLGNRQDTPDLLTRFPKELAIL